MRARPAQSGGPGRSRPGLRARVPPGPLGGRSYLPLRQVHAEAAAVAEHDWIIEVGSERAGCYWVREHPGELELVRLWLLTRWQNRGLGSAVVAELCARADAERLPFRLRVLKANPARSLYERFGFAVTDETDTHYLMRRPAPPP